MGNAQESRAGADLPFSKHPDYGALNVAGGLRTGPTVTTTSASPVKLGGTVTVIFVSDHGLGTVAVGAMTLAFVVPNFTVLVAAWVAPKPVPVMVRIPPAAVA